MRIIFVITTLIAALGAQAQKKERFKFAQTYFAAGINYLTSSEENGLNYLSQRLAIGGLHFWCKADFYVSFQVAIQNLNANKNKLVEGVMTGGRWIPMGLKRNGLRPFVGAHWQTPTLYVHGIRLEKNAFSPEAGFYYLIGNSLSIDLGFRLNPMNNWDVPYTTKGTNSSNLAFDLNLKKYFDFTAGNNQAFIDRTETDIEANGDQNVLGFGLGVSAAIAVAPIGFLKEDGYEPNKSVVSILPEFGLSYYSHKKEMVIRLAYRPTKRAVSGSNFSYTLVDNRLSLEIFKFLFDYNGFMPFLGLSACNSFYNMDFKTRNGVLNPSGNNQSLALVFGWDKRPTQADWFILRTNLRFQPKRGYDRLAQQYFSRDLEFNFIQMVVYPERMKYYFK